MKTIDIKHDLRKVFLLFIEQSQEWNQELGFSEQLVNDLISTFIYLLFPKMFEQVESCYKFWREKEQSVEFLISENEFNFTQILKAWDRFAIFVYSFSPLIKQNKIVFRKDELQQMKETNLKDIVRQNNGYFKIQINENWRTWEYDSVFYIDCCAFFEGSYCYLSFGLPESISKLEERLKEYQLHTLAIPKRSKEDGTKIQFDFISYF